MSIAVTGATGNLGTALVEHLLATRANLQITGIARRVPGSDETRGTRDGSIEHFT